MRNPNAPFSAYDYKTEKEPYLFVSYAHADSDQVYPYIRRLHDDGFRIWYDEGIPFSREWDVEVATALAGAAMMVLFISPTAVQRPNVKKELNLAINRNVPIMPLYLEKTTLPLAWDFHLGAPQAVLDIHASYGKLKGDLDQSARRFVAPAPFPPIPIPAKPMPEPKQPPEIGSIISFGPYEWRLLDLRGYRALLVTKDIIELRAFDKIPGTTWQTCSLRSWLNNEFLDQFSKEDQKYIVAYDISDEKTLKDKIFLLSSAEVFNNFNSESDRVAKFNDKAFWWWLRSPGYDRCFADSVSTDGRVYAAGNYRNTQASGVRPALWLNLN